MFVGNTKKIRKPRPWRHNEPITRAELERMREEFWDTAPHYGGQRGKALELSFVNNNC